MKEKVITTTFYQSEYNLLDKKEKELIDLSVKSLSSAYAPYSV